MKHDFKIQENDHPLWHLFVCSTCGKDMRISKWEMRRLLRGEWIYVRDFLPPCSPMVPEAKAMDKEEKQPGDYMLEWLTDWFARGPLA